MSQSRLHPDDLAELARLVARELHALTTGDPSSAETPADETSQTAPGADGKPQSRRRRRAERHAALADAPPILPGQMKATLEQLAVRYAVSLDFAEKHKADWGPEPLSDASNSKLRYDIATADSWWADRRRGPGPQRHRPGPKPKPKSPTHTHSGVPLLAVI